MSLVAAAPLNECEINVFSVLIFSISRGDSLALQCEIITLVPRDEFAGAANGNGQEGDFIPTPGPPSRLVLSCSSRSGLNTVLLGSFKCPGNFEVVYVSSHSWGTQMGGGFSSFTNKLLNGGVSQRDVANFPNDLLTLNNPAVSQPALRLIVGLRHQTGIKYTSSLPPILPMWTDTV